MICHGPKALPSHVPVLMRPRSKEKSSYHQPGFPGHSLTDIGFKPTIQTFFSNCFRVTHAKLAGGRGYTMAQCPLR